MFMSYIFSISFLVENAKNKDGIYVYFLPLKKVQAVPQNGAGD